MLDVQPEADIKDSAGSLAASVERQLQDNSLNASPRLSEACIVAAIQLIGTFEFSLVSCFLYPSLFAFHLAELARPTTQLLNETHKFSELVLTRMVLLMDQSRSVLPLRSAKAREVGELWREKCTRASWTFPYKLIGNNRFWPARTGKWKATLDSAIVA